MSGDLNQVQAQMVTNELVHSLKSLSVPQSTVAYADAIELLCNQLKAAIPDGLSKNQTLALTLVDHLHHLVPVFDDILCNSDPNDRSFRNTNKFLQMLSDAFDGICLFGLFSKVPEKSQLEAIFQNYIGLLKEAYFSDNDKYDHLTTCIIPVIALSSLLITVKETDIPPTLLAYLLAFANAHWQPDNRERVVKYILILLKVFSKKPILVPMIIRYGWAQTCVQLLKNGVGTKGERPSFNVDYYICLILQKLARHNLGVEALNQLECMKALDQSKESLRKAYTEPEFACINFLQCMIYALLMESEQIKEISLLNDGYMCQVLDQLIIHTLEASRDESFFYKCFHISEILTVLSKLFVNDDILTKSINENKQLLDCLCQLIMHFAAYNLDPNRTRQPTDDETLLALSNLLWSISFHQCYQDRFRANSMLMHTLSNLASSSSSSYSGTKSKSIPRDLCSLKKAAEGIIWNLKSSKPTPLVATPSSEKSQAQPMAMISYCHSDATFCRELVERLSGHVPVWVDYKQAHDAMAHSDDLWEEIARGMEMATVIVLIVSKEYYDSKSCRQELSYATDTLRKRIVPVYAPYQQYRASGWLGIRIAGQKYIHFGRKLFNDAVNELASLVVNEQKPAVVQYTTPPPSLPALSESTAETTSYSVKTLEKADEGQSKLSILRDWTKEDIQKWFVDNHIHANLLTLYADRFLTGTALLVYARHLKCFYRNEFIRIYAKYNDAFDGKRLETLDFVTFVDALYRLRTEYDPNCTLEDKYANQQLLVDEKTSEDGMTWLWTSSVDQCVISPILIYPFIYTSIVKGEL